MTICFTVFASIGEDFEEAAGPLLAGRDDNGGVGLH